jgi:hypothetical protein
MALPYFCLKAMELLSRFPASASGKIPFRIKILSQRHSCLDFFPIPGES